MTTEDHVDRLRALWAQELPDLDTTPMSILGRIYRLSNLVRPSIEATFAEFHLDRGEFDVIATIRRSGPPYRMIPTELYRHLMISSGGLTHRLDRLEKAGLVTRERSDQDKRSFVVVLTAEGIRRAEAAFREDMGRELGLLDALDEGERRALSGLLRKLAGSLEPAEGEASAADSV
ncbi:MarR family transcriptional regulator [Rhizobium sp. BG4]|uniref:MarR family winged helix-turn-helix transcriptional regulator n=1 Tax=Rhizobium sp. BG4 TaxID=2613770 RepID=UPI00193D274A|nr:MarR family transcriptional regulator [Rhizobium sp. BG4]QRM45329.1 MarR family transcriptional regulator [Rhizobium sp. BG4]